jgi:hypothetical protein|tara:strand:+ start:159 stop:365 length:207 start_codon:yes stop_codon:yes gene_type:complete
MKTYMLQANELWLTNVYNNLKEGGVWIWKDELMLFKREGKKLLCDKKSYNKVSEIVSEEFLTRTFKKY